MSQQPSVDLFAMQTRMEWDHYLRADAFEAKILSFLPEIKQLRGENAGPGIVVFPEDIGMFLVAEGSGEALRGCATADEAFNRMALKYSLKIALAMARHRQPQAQTAFWLARAPIIRDIMLRTFSRFALESGMYVVAGSASLPKNKHGLVSQPFAPLLGKVFNLSYTFGPDGKLLAETAKVNLVPGLEDSIGLSAGRPGDVQTIDVGGANLATAICYDGFRCAHTEKEPGFTPLIPLYDRMGVDIIAWPAANPWPWEAKWVFAKPGDERMRKQQWVEEGARSLLAAQSRVAYVVNPQLVAHFLDLCFDGQSTIFAREGSTVRTLAQAVSIDQSEIIHARASLRVAPQPSIVSA